MASSDLRQGYKAYEASRSMDELLSTVAEIRCNVGIIQTGEQGGLLNFGRDALHLVCFDYVWS